MAEALRASTAGWRGREGGWGSPGGLGSGLALVQEDAASLELPQLSPALWD